MPKIQSAHAVLLFHDKYILQLRDNKPTISAAGEWSLFGGLVESLEKAFETITREIYEELLLKPSKFTYLWSVDYFSSFDREIIRTWFFVSDVTVVWSEHKLQEGQAAKVFRFRQISSLEMPPVMRQTIEMFHKGARRA